MSDASDSLAKSAREYVDRSLGTVHEMAARIAGLEAENSNLREADREADRVLSAWVGRAELAEAELAKFQSQLCDGCGFGETE